MMRFNQHVGTAHYPRPSLPSDSRWVPPKGGLGVVAVLWGFAALVGLLSAFDILIVGEELSLLGDRAHTYFVRSSDEVHYRGELLVGLSAFGLSIARLVILGGLLTRARWGYVGAAILLGPFTVLDLCMWSLPYAIVVVSANIYLLGVVVRRFAAPM